MLRTMLQPVAQAVRSVAGKRLGARIERTMAEAAGTTSRDIPPPGTFANSAQLDVNLMLHQSRSAMLRGMPPGARRLLSAGCAGTWYFEWISQTYGPVEEHLGIEFFEPRPNDLPGNVTWIANTASDMSAVQDASCDMVFSGQNLEHLWPEEVAGFALEAARVLQPGGHLVIDSPNRTVTSAQRWSHPQHTIELTPDEAGQLVQLAGFDVTALRGIWLCRDPRNGETLAFDPNVADKRWSVVERLIYADRHPEHSFIWWLEAERSTRTPDAGAVRAYMDDLFRQHWPERVQRLLSQPGHTIETLPDGTWVHSSPGQTSCALYGPYMPLKAGRYRVTWRFRWSHAGAGPGAICDVMVDGRDEPIVSSEVSSGVAEASLDFALSGMTFGLQYRCRGTGHAGFAVLRDVVLDQTG
jgi:hypothetical protein